MNKTQAIERGNGKKRGCKNVILERKGLREEGNTERGKFEEREREERLNSEETTQKGKYWRERDKKER